jgi:hypothetical protein
MSVETSLHRTLSQLVIKSHVSIGGLSRCEQQLVFAYVWSGLPGGRVLSEAQINDALKRQLDGAVCFLGTDHVELRRWLVDAGALQRDDFGREYRRVSTSRLPAPLRDLAELLEGLDPADFTAAERRRHEAERAARRARWAETQASTPGLTASP